MDLGLQGRVAVVTGASRGIGRAVALLLATEGVRVGIGYRSDSRAAAAVVSEIEALGGRAIAVAADLAAPPDVERFITTVSAKLGPVEILVSNAGVWPTARVEAITNAEWERVIAVNLTATFVLVRSVLPEMRARKYGRIVAISSQAAVRGSVSGHSHYAAAKAGLLGFIRSVAREAARDGITANAILPGIIKTDMIGNAPEGRQEEWLQEIPIGRFGEPAEAAALVAFLCSNQAAFITGAAIPINGGQHMG